MKKNLLIHIVLVFLSVSSHIGFGQSENFNGINLQGQLQHHEGETIDFEILLYSDLGDTIWYEIHELVELTDEGEFSLVIGLGNYMSGSAIEFKDIDWGIIQKVELYKSTDARIIIGEYVFKAIPYAFHSQRLAQNIKIIDLVDVEADVPLGEEVLKFDGISFYFDSDLTSDTTLYGFFADSTYFSDTVLFAYRNDDYADTSIYSFLNDTAYYSQDIESVFLTDTARIVDSTAITTFSMGNWGIAGNSDLADTNFVGTKLDIPFRLSTNGIQRLYFEDTTQINNGISSVGFGIHSVSGHLMELNDNPGPSFISRPFIYAEGLTNAFHGGSIDSDFDTLKGAYSFSFGENTGTNGTYSTVFGKNTFGDSNSIALSSISSFAFGRDCKVSWMGVAIGDSAIADFRRNVAIGKNVSATNFNSNFAMGNDVYMGAAVAIGIGNKLSSTGHFSVLFGTNVTNLGDNGAFQYGDFSTSEALFSTNPNQFMLRSAGGVIFYTTADLSMGVELLPGGGSWSMISDRNKKMNINRLNPILYSEYFKRLSISSWNYIGYNTAHVGPMAQDIYSIFEVGESPLMINMIDADGVTFLGIKMLNEKLKNITIAENIELFKEDVKLENESYDNITVRINNLYEKLDNN